MLSIVVLVSRVTSNILAHAVCEEHAPIGMVCFYDCEAKPTCSSSRLSIPNRLWTV
jgi:hypothetical protein